MTNVKCFRSYCQSYVSLFVTQWIIRLDTQSTAGKYYDNEAQDSEGSFVNIF